MESSHSWNVDRDALLPHSYGLTTACSRYLVDRVGVGFVGTSGVWSQPALARPYGVVVEWNDLLTAVLVNGVSRSVHDLLTSAELWSSGAYAGCVRRAVARLGALDRSVDVDDHCDALPPSVAPHRPPHDGCCTG